MLSIGLTGGIGSGKSIVAQIFSTLGVPVLDADALAKKIMHENDEVKSEIIHAFGVESYNEQGLNRSFIANIVFKDPFQLQLLNSIVHPATIEASKYGPHNKMHHTRLKKQLCFLNLVLRKAWISLLVFTHPIPYVFNE